MRENEEKKIVYFPLFFISINLKKFFKKKFLKYD